jgi:hypothetical protein
MKPNDIVMDITSHPARTSANSVIFSNVLSMTNCVHVESVGLISADMPSGYADCMIEFQGNYFPYGQNYGGHKYQAVDSYGDITIPPGARIAVNIVAASNTADITLTVTGYILPNN